MTHLAPWLARRCRAGASRAAAGALLCAVLGLCGVAQAVEPYDSMLRARQQQLQRLRRTPAGVVALHGAVAELSDWVPSADLDALVALGQRRDNHPRVRGLARVLALELARGRGQWGRAAALARAAGVLQRWYICGPLPARSHGDQQTVSAVERDLRRGPHPELRYAGQRPVRWVRWRPLPHVLRSPAIPLGSLLGSFTTPAVVYLHAVVRSPAQRRVLLLLGTGGPFRVFVNGQLVGHGGVERTAAPDQDAVPLPLQPGANGVVIELSVSRTTWAVFARLQGGAGEALGGLSQPEVTRSLQLAPPGGAPATQALDHPAAWLRRQAAAPGAGVQQLRDWAQYLLRSHWLGRRDSEVDRALRRWARQQGDGEGWLALARVQTSSEAKHALLMRAQRTAPRDPAVLVALARLDAVRERPLSAARWLARVLRQVPGYLPARLELAESYRMAGLGDSATRVLRLLARRHPAVAGVSDALAQMALSRDDVPLARRLLRRQLATHATDVSTWRTLADLALRRGDARAARHLLRRAIEREPLLVYPRMRLASVLEGMGDSAAAARQYREVLRIDPAQVRALQRLGHVLYRAGKPRQAFATWRRALRLQPQNADLRRYVATLRRRRSWGRAEQLRQNTRALVARARKTVGSCTAQARVLLEATVAEVHPSGLSRRLHQRVVQVCQPAGAALASEALIPFNPDRQIVTVIKAETQLAAGGSRSAREQERELNEPFSGLWYDLRARALRFSGLRAGDVVELEYVVEDVAEHNLYADYFGDLVTLEEQVPVERFSYTLVMPAERQVGVHVPRVAGLQRSVQRKDAVRIYRWWARGLPAVAEEPGMPGPTEVAHYLHLSTFRRWADVARWYWNLLQGQLTATAELRALAHRLAAGSQNDEQRVRAVHNYVAQKTRYVGLEFGVHSFKPYAASQVLQRRFGDCKDKATLIIALLRVLGVEAEMVLVRTRRRGKVEQRPPSLEPFDHAVVYVPALKRYLDATAEFAGTSELPHQDQGVMALHVGPAGRHRLTRTPLQTAGANTVRVWEQLQLQASGDALLRERRLIRGQAAPRWREHYQSPDERLRRFQKSWSRWNAAATVQSVTMAGLQRLEQPVRVAAVVRLRGLGRVLGPRRLSVPVGSGPREPLVQRMAPSTVRKQDLLLAFPWRHEAQVTLRPPAGWRVAQAPHDVRLTTPFGSFRRTVRRAGGGQLEVALELSIDVRRVPAARYADFRRFLQRIDTLLDERVTLVR